MPERPIGAHVRVSGGLAKAGLAYAEAVGAEAIQVFAANPRGWAMPTGDPSEDHKLREHAERTGLAVFVHSPYLINLGSPDPLTRERSAASLAHSLRRGRVIGALGVVVHTGSAVTSGRDEGLRRVREILLPLLDGLGDDGPDLLVEPMAGQGQMLCARMSDFGPFLGAIDWHPRAGICLDTCHAFAAGHDLAAQDGVAAMLTELTQATRAHPVRGGGSRLRLIHANDSKDGCGSHRDRHENIGHGGIGADAFGSLLHHPLTAAVPFIVETPGGRDEVAADVATLKRLRAERPSAAAPQARRG